MREQTKGATPGQRSLLNVEAGQTIRTGDGSLTILHHDHGQAYHSLDGAFFEARELYIERSGFRTRLLEYAAGAGAKSCGLRVLDVGLGLGYNALATIDTWVSSEQACSLGITSLEHDDALLMQLLSGLASWQEGWSADWLNWVRLLGASSRAQLAECVTAINIEIPHPKKTGVVCCWQVLLGDAIDSVGWLSGNISGEGLFDFVWQDPFSPEMNPRLWGVDWFSQVAKIVNPGACLMTYSVARTVRDALKDSGWDVKRIKGSKTKRNWLRASKL